MTGVQTCALPISLKAARDAKAATGPRFRVITVSERARAEEIARALTGGAAVPAAAAPAVPLESLDEPARAAAVPLAPGEVSEVVPTAGGFMVVKRER